MHEDVIMKVTIINRGNGSAMEMNFDNEEQGEKAIFLLLYLI